MKTRNLLIAGGMLLLPGCQPREETWYLKVEWGELQDNQSLWLGDIRLGGAQILEVYPYNYEEGDQLLKPTLSFATVNSDSMTDGMIVAFHPRKQPRLWFLSNHGDAHVDLDDVAAGTAVGRDLRFQARLDVARLTADEWEAARGYADKTVSRSDSLPQIFYRHRLKMDRYQSEEDAEAKISARAANLYQTSTWFHKAEDLRRGVNEQLYVTTPSILQVGESFDLHLVAVDLWGDVANTFTGPVEITVEGEGVELPPEVELTAAQDGNGSWEVIGSAITPGQAKIVVTDPSGQFGPGAIPVWVEEAPRRRIYWGDLHAHSHLSDGDFADITPEDVYRYSRDVAHLDFQAMTDHDYRRPVPDWKWPLQLVAAARFYDPGRYTTLVGYEWSAEDLRFSEVAGHKNVIFRTTTPPVYSAWDSRYNTPERLWAALRENPGVGNAITIPHHPVRPIGWTEDSPQIGGIGTDWNYHDPELQPLVEVYSRWGSSELTGASNPRPVKSSRNTGSGQYALGLGYQLGFMASSDSHDGTPGVSVLPARVTVNVYPVGLTAVLAPSLTREDVFDALASRQCYGTSGGRRILMDLSTTSGLGIGEEGEETGTPTFHIKVAGTTTLSRIDLIQVTPTKTRVVDIVTPTTWYWEGEIEDADVSEGGAYYLKVTQEDSEMGWMGPIFLKRPTPEE